MAEDRKFTRAELLALADKAERHGHVYVVPSDLHREISRERRTQIICRAMAEYDGFDPDEMIDRVTMRLRWREYEGYLRVADRGVSRITAAEMAEALRVRALASADTQPEAGDVQQAPLVSGAVPNASEADAHDQD